MMKNIVIIFNNTSYIVKGDNIEHDSSCISIWGEVGNESKVIAVAPLTSLVLFDVDK